MPAANAVHLYVDLPGLIKRVQQALPPGLHCRVWNPPQDPLSILWIDEAYAREVKGNGNILFSPLQYQFRESHLPRQFMPNLQVNGAPLSGTPVEMIQQMFRAEFASSMLAADTPRDQLLRGNFSSATTALSELKERNDRFRERIVHETFTSKDIDDWARKASEVYGNIARAERVGDGVALAQAKADEAEFLRSPLSEKIALLTRGGTSRLLSAEASYQLALIMHERAELAQARYQREADDKNREDALSWWATASDAWRRYLDNYNDLRKVFHDRDSHASRLKQECETAQAQTNARGN